jgi:hypothetical protein
MAIYKTSAARKSLNDAPITFDKIKNPEVVR